MAKSTGLAIFALIIGAGGLGLGAFTMVNFQVIEGPEGPEGQDGVDAVSGITNVWSDFYYLPTDTNPVSQVIPIDQLLINFTVNSGESAFFLFSTYATVVAGAPSFILFNFLLDGSILSSPQYPERILETWGTRIDAPVSFHLALETISAGAHNISIGIYGSDVSNTIFSSTLLVQTYIS